MSSKVDQERTSRSKAASQEQVRELQRRMDMIENRLDNRPVADGGYANEYAVNNFGQRTGIVDERGQTPMTYERLYETAVDTGITLGIIGVLASLVVHSAGFGAVFVIGTIFLIWARFHGPSFNQ